MTRLSEIPFKSLQVGMIFKHPQHGEQIILDLDRNSFGPVIKFHNSDLYSGKLPVMMEEDSDIFQELAKTIFPCGAEEWEYSGMITPEQLSFLGWLWYEVTCPHCGSIYKLIATEPPSSQRQCLTCGMVHRSPFRVSSSLYNSS